MPLAHPLNRPLIGRIWYAATALTALAALAVQVFVTASAGDARYGAAARVLNLFTYFSIQSNLLVGAVSLLVAIGGGRAATWFRALWVAALVGISVTAIVFHALLAGLQDLSGAGALADWAFHTAVPILFLSGWLLLGPRSVVRATAVALSLLFPLGWLAMTLVRGALTGYYPYPFLDVARIGVAQMLASVAVIAALNLGLAVAFGAIDAALARRARRGGAAE